MRKKLFKSTFLSILIALSISANASADKAIQHAVDVSLHKLFAELSLAVRDEFGLTYKGDQTLVADGFATLYFTEYRPDIATRIMKSRITSLEKEKHVSESMSDRASLMACLFYGANPKKNEKHLGAFKLSDKDKKACQFAAVETKMSWQKRLQPTLLKGLALTHNVELIYGDGPSKDEMISYGIFQYVEAIAEKFNWPKKLTLHFDHCDVGVKWHKKTRTLLYCDETFSNLIDQYNDK